MAGFDAGERARLLGRLSEAIARFRAGDVYRIPAQAQLAWARTLP